MLSRFWNSPLKLFWISQIAALLLRLIFAALIPLGNDEVYYWDWARDLQLSYFDHPPGVAWLGYLSQHLFFWTTPELAARGLVPFCHLLSTWFVLLIVRQLKGERAELSKSDYFWTFILCNAVPVFGLGGIMLMPDVGLILFSSLAMLIVVSRVQRQFVFSANRLPVFLGMILGAVLGGACLFKYHGVLILLGVVVFILNRRKKFAADLPFWLAFVICYFIIIAPILVWNYQNHLASFLFQGGRGLDHANWQVKTFLRVLLAQVAFLSPLFFFLYLKTIFLPTKIAQWKIFRILTLLMALPILVVLTFFSFRIQTLPHWFVPAWWLLTPLVVLEVSGRRKYGKLLWANIFYASLLLLIAPMILCCSALRQQLVSQFNGKPGALGELTFWPEVVRDQNFLDKIRRSVQPQRHSHCPEQSLLASTRWFSVAHLAFSLPEQPKVLSFDRGKKSYYSYRDELSHYEGCDLVLVSETDHFDMNELEESIDVREVLTYEHSDYKDRSLKIAYGTVRVSGPTSKFSTQIQFRELNSQEALQTSQTLKFRSRYRDTIRRFGMGPFREANMASRDVDVIDRENLSIDLAGKYMGYFGTLHSHTGWSDGKGNPELAMKFARDVARLDFFAVTEHPEYWLFENKDRWEKIGKIAQLESTKQFVGLRGFEFSHIIYGHYTVLNSEDYCGANKCSNLKDFYDWLSLDANKDAFTFFNHPGYLRQMTRALEHGHYFDISQKLKERIVGMEVIHWDGYEPFLYGFDGKLPYIDFAISRGWYLAPSGSQDNHSPNWGVAGPNRTVVLLESLNRENLFEAIRKRRFYATTNTNIHFAFDVQNQKNWFPMGSVLKIKDLAGDQINFKTRFFDADNKNPPRLFEVVMNQKVIGQYVFGQKSKNRDVSTGTMAGEWSFSIPKSALEAKQRSYIYVRFFQGEDYQPFTESSPIYFEN